MLIWRNIFYPVIDKSQRFVIRIVNMFCAVFGFFTNIDYFIFFSFKLGCELFCRNSVYRINFKTGFFPGFKTTFKMSDNSCLLYTSDAADDQINV